MDLGRFPRVRLAHLPTPFEPLDRLSEHLGGPRIWVKRDDCTGLATGGNKTRKLEFVIADALARGCDTVLTAGSVQSNHARQSAAAAARHGLACHLVLPRNVPWNDPSYELGGNLVMDRLLGAEVHLHPGGIDREAEMERLAKALAGAGATPYVIPVGASNSLGALGYVKCALELLAQASDAGFAIDAVVHASGSGGTQAGLLVGLQAMGTRARLVGVNDSDTAEELARVVWALAQETAERLGVSERVSPDAVECLDGYVGPGYGLPSEGMKEALRLCARLEGLLLDPVYSGKAMAGLIDQVRRGRWGREDNVVFVHTGGVAALSPYASAFETGS
jgi:L-cysteate sulfo-lyase